MRLRRAEKGFSHLLILLLILLLLLLAFIFWRVMGANNKQASDSGSQSSQQAEDDSQEAESEEPEMATYTSSYEGLKFDYPVDWKKTDTDATSLEEAADGLLLTSPQGTKVIWSSAIDGIGGSCDPATDGTYSVSAFEESDNLPGVYYVEFKKDNKLIAVGLANEVAGAKPKVGDTGDCMLLPTFPSKKNNTGMWLKSVNFDPTKTDDLAAVKKILLSARY